MSPLKAIRTQLSDAHVRLVADRNVATLRSCWWTLGYKHGNRTLVDNLERCKITSFHASCAASKEEKLETMTRMLRKTAGCSVDGRRRGGRLGVATDNAQTLGAWGPRAKPFRLVTGPGRTPK